MTSLAQSGAYVLIRDEDGKLITRVIGNVNDKTTPRQLLRKLTNNGADLYVRLHDIAMGKPHVVQMADGSRSEPMIPTLEAQRMASKDLIEFLHGKAVAQTEVKAAEEQAQQMEMIQALSDDELQERVRAALLERSVPGELVPNAPEPAQLEEELLDEDEWEPEE